MNHNYYGEVPFLCESSLCSWNWIYSLSNTSFLSNLIFILWHLINEEAAVVNLNQKQLPLRCKKFRKLLKIFQLENKSDTGAQILVFTCTEKSRIWNLNPLKCVRSLTRSRTKISFLKGPLQTMHVWWSLKAINLITPWQVLQTTAESWAFIQPCRRMMRFDKCHIYGNAKALLSWHPCHPRQIKHRRQLASST